MKNFNPYTLLVLASRVFADPIACGVAHGYDRGPNAYFYSGDGSLSNFDACSNECQGSAQCQSFAFGNNQCLLYTKPLDASFRQQDNSPFLFYDRDCKLAQPTSSFQTLLPPTAAQPTNTSPTANPNPASDAITTTTPQPAVPTLASTLDTAVAGVTPTNSPAPTTQMTAVTSDTGQQLSTPGTSKVTNNTFGPSSSANLSPNPSPNPSVNPNANPSASTTLVATDSGVGSGNANKSSTSLGKGNATTTTTTTTATLQSGFSSGESMTASRVSVWWVVALGAFVTVL